MFKNYFVLLTAVLFCFTACEEQTFDPVLTLGAASVLSAPADNSSYVITEESLDSTLANFAWSAADFGVATEVTYTLQVDLAGNDFAEPTAVFTGTRMTSADVLNSAINGLLINLGLPGNVEQALVARVKAVVGLEGDGNVLFSNLINFNVTPFEVEIEYPQIYVPGAHQGWDPPSAPTIFSVESNGNYDGYVYFADAGNEFKFTDAPNWDNGNFGDDDGDGVFENGGGNIVATDAGVHRLTVDINAGTYTVTRTDWGIIGAATPGGWDADTDMVYDAETGIYSVTLDMVAGSFKFRANDDWSIDLGDNDADLEMEYGGGDIMLEEGGNYTIELLLNRAVYTYTVTRN